MMYIVELSSSGVFYNRDVRKTLAKLLAKNGIEGRRDTFYSYRYIWFDLKTRRFIEPHPWLDKKYSERVKISIQELIELIKQ